MDSTSLLGSNSDSVGQSTGHKNSGSFQYQPLNHKKLAIRLVRVLLDLSAEGDLRCEMWHTTTRSRYECLSYRWGALTNPKRILIKNTEAPDSQYQPFQVGENLHAFLHAARANPELGDTFWIDALCIDQQNVPERNHQVTQMGDIYSQASRVVVWLGNYPEVVRRGAKDEVFNAFWEQLGRNEYWHRAWITQEFVLPRHIDFLINDSVVPYLESSVGARQQKRIYTLMTMRNLYDKQRKSLWHRLWVGGISLSDDFFLFNAREVECTVPRDRIYSLLALLQEGKSITVNYEWPVSQVVYQLLRLYKGFLSFWDVLRLIALVRDRDKIYDDYAVTCGPHIEFRVYFTGVSSRATNWHCEMSNVLVDKLLGRKGLGKDTVIRGFGFTIKRRDCQSLMLDVKVTLARLSVFLEDIDAWEMPYFPVIPHPNFDAELEAWVKSDSSFSHYLYTRIFGNHTNRTRDAWGQVRADWDPTPNGRSIPHNLFAMGLSLGRGC